MSGRINLLAALLALQLAAVGVLLFTDLAGGGAGQSTFLDGDPAAVSALEIFDAEGGSVRLERGTDGWTAVPLADAQSASRAALPADDAKVAEVLDKLLGQRVQWPVGTTAETRERFEVTDSAFQRKLVLTDAAGQVTEVYLGTSPGYRRVHARRVDAEEVYSIDFANFQVPAELDEWVDKSLLAAQGSISRVARQGAWTLSRDGDAWLVDGRAADAQTATGLIDRLGELRIVGVLPAEEDVPADEESAPAATLSVQDEEGSYDLRLWGSEDADEYRVASDRVEGRFTAAAYVAEQLLLKADDLAAKDGEPEGAGEPDSGR